MSPVSFKEAAGTFYSDEKGCSVFAPLWKCQHDNLINPALRCETETQEAGALYYLFEFLSARFKVLKGSRKSVFFFFFNVTYSSSRSETWQISCRCFGPSIASHLMKGQRGEAVCEHTEVLTE